MTGVSIVYSSDEKLQSSLVSALTPPIPPSPTTHTPYPCQTHQSPVALVHSPAWTTRRWPHQQVNGSRVCSAPARRRRRQHDLNGQKKTCSHFFHPCLYWAFLCSYLMLLNLNSPPTLLEGFRCFWYVLESNKLARMLCRNACASGQNLLTLEIVWKLLFKNVWVFWEFPCILLCLCVCVWPLWLISVFRARRNYEFFL